MTEPREVLSQLLSDVQAEALAAGGARGWAVTASALEMIAGAAPTLEDAEGRLVMPDEIADEFAEPHLVLPITLSTDQDQEATAYIVVPTDKAAAFFGAEAPDPSDQEQQAVVMASAILGQVISSWNMDLFGSSPNGLILTLDDIEANNFGTTVGGLEEPGLLYAATLGGAKPVPLRVFLPGTFLDVIAGSFPAAAGEESVEGAEGAEGDEHAEQAAQMMAANDSAIDLPFELTLDELNSAEILDMPLSATAAKPTPAAEPVSVAGGGASRPAQPPPPREPTPISQASVHSASFAPLPDEPVTPRDSGIDLLAGLEMNVSVELGRTDLTVADVLDLGPGSVIELDRLAGEPVDILVNDRIIARGEVVVVDENFGVRVVEVLRRGVQAERTG